ncbi:hypothetical protein BGZ58_007708 [Dissophora ornata]|nr:hypothetical protein BGZ58_007708 [Dissophora ornata]
MLTEWTMQVVSLRSARPEPATIFTIANFTTGNGKAAGILFNNIAKAVLEHGSGSLLRLDQVQCCRQKCMTDGAITEGIDEILGLFHGELESFPVLGNSDCGTKRDGGAEEHRIA